jgi:hypothetical protein
MTDAAKSDGQVAYEAACMGNINIPFYHLQANQQEMWKNLEAAVVANASARIRAETVEDVIVYQREKFNKCCGGYKVGEDLQEAFDDGDAELRALADAPPGFVCVPVEPTEAMVRAGVLSWEGPAFYKNVTEKAAQCSEDEIRCAYKAMLAESGK